MSEALDNVFKIIVKSYQYDLRKEKEQCQNIIDRALEERDAAMRRYQLAGKKMGNYHRLIDKANSLRKVTWVRNIVVPLMWHINQITGLNFDLSDLCTFGLRAACTVTARGGENDSIIAYLTFTPLFGDGCFKLYVDTGETTDRYPVGSLGFFNGENNVTEEVVSVQTVIDNLHRRYPHLFENDNNKTQNQ